MKLIDRELKKAIIAFKLSRFMPYQIIATGNWGCGAFGGDPELKLIIQWLAASILQKNIIYCQYEQIELPNKINELIKTGFKDKPIKIIYQSLKSYSNKITLLGKKIPSIIDYLKNN